VPVLSIAAVVLLAALPLLVSIVAWPLFLVLALITLVWVPIVTLALLASLVLLPLAAVLLLPPLLVRRPYLLFVLPFVLMKLPVIFGRLTQPSPTGARAMPRRRAPLSLNL
jgi:hypothetical protein